MIGSLASCPEDVLPEALTQIWTAHHLRWVDRDNRMDAIERVVTGNWSIVDEDDAELVNGSPNLIQVALEDTAESASLVPTIRAAAKKASATSQEAENRLERVASSYLDASEMPLLTIRSLMDYVGAGFFVWICRYDKQRGPVLEYRPARTAYPEPSFSTLGETNRCVFARDMYLTQLEAHNPEWHAKVMADINFRHSHLNFNAFQRLIDQKVTLIEVYDDSTTAVGVTWDSSASGAYQGTMAERTGPNYVTTVLERVENETGYCPVVIGQRPSYDGEPRGQFDQVISVLRAHQRLQGMVLDYTADMVYADLWVKDIVGDLPKGGAGVIELGPNGAIGRVPPATPSLSVYNEMAGLMDSIHIGGRWPKSRMGDIDQAIASAKFIESTVGIMNQVIRTAHLVLKPAVEKALCRLVCLDSKYGGERRQVTGVHRNQKYQLERKLSDLDGSITLRAEYGLGLGRDPAQSMVLGIQAAQSEIVSWEYVQENIPGITDVGLERSRIDSQKFRELLLASIAQSAQQGTLPPAAIIDMMQARENGKSLADVYREYVVKPQEEQASQMLTSGLTGEQMMPGMPPGPPGMAPPQAPSAADLFGGLIPQGDEDPETIARTSVPLGEGSFVGVQS